LQLRATDEIAGEITGITRLFYDAIAPHLARVVVVDTNQFRLITQFGVKGSLCRSISCRAPDSCSAA
jgi:hypothetical protein